VLEDKTTVPRNTGGILWWGDVLEEVKGEVRAVLPPKRLFRIELVEAGGVRRVDFDLEFAPGQFADTGFSPWGRRLVLLKPRKGLRPGATYRFSSRVRKERFMRSPTVTKELTKVEIRVDPKSFLAIDVAPSLAMGEQVMGPLQVRKGASCRTVVTAAQQPLTFTLPAAAERWRSTLVYAVTIDGKKGWRPAPHNCADVPHGTSWVGFGKELLFVRCSGDSVADSLPEGQRLVTMVAWLPGTSVFLRAEGRATIRCQ
jgi:hypothetical protein